MNSQSKFRLKKQSHASFGKDGMIGSRPMSCLRRSAWVVMFALAFFVNGTAWGQSTTQGPNDCIKVTYVQGSGTPTVTYYQRLTTSGGVTGALNAVGGETAGTAANRKVYTIELLWPDTDSRLTNQYTVDNTTTYNKNYKDITIKTAEGSSFKATIKRGNYAANQGMFSLTTTTSGTLTFENIILDGMNIQSSVAGAILSVASSTVNINTGTVLQNGNTSGNGGLVNVSGGTLNIDGATLQNGTAAVGAIISKAGTGELKITDSEFNGGSAISALIAITAGSGDVTIKGTTINGESATGSIISKAGTGALNIGEEGSPVTINGGSTPSTLVNITAGATTMSNTTINGQTSSGTLISNSGTGAMSFTGCTINGSTTAADNTLVSKSNTGATTFTNTTITRNQSKGYGFVNSSSGTVTFDGCTIDGSNNTAATNSLITMGTGALTLNNTTVSGHTVSTADVCAVDATAGTANVNVSGTTNIADNTSASLPANLAVNGTNRLKIGYDASHNSLTGTIGVTTPKIENEQFAILGNAAYTGHEYLMNDKDEDFYAEVVSNTTLFWRSSATPCFYIGTTTYTTLKAAVNQAATNTTIYSCTNEYTMKEPVNMGSKVITIQPGNALDENGQPNGESIERLILNRGARATSDLITTGAALTLNNITLDGGEVEATGSFIKVTAGALTLNNVTINGGKTTANLIHDTGAAAMTITDSEINGSTVANSGNLVYKQVNAASGAVTFTNTTFNGNEVTGDLISLSNTGSNRTMNVIFDNCTVNGAANGSGSLVSKATNGTFSATNGSAFYGNGSTGTLINLSNSTGNTTFSNATINGGTSTGDLLSDAGTGTLSFTDCSINGSTVAASNTLVSKSNTGAVTFTNTTMTRNQSNGNGFINSSSGAVTFTNCIIDGSENADATQPLIKSGTGNLTLTNTMVTGHNVSATGVCAVDATSSGNIDVSGETSITGNTSNGDPANLKASGTNKLRIPNGLELSLTVGVTSTDNFTSGQQFAVLGNTSSSGYQYFQNDIHDNLFGKKSGTNITWGEYNSPTDASVFRIFVAADDDYYYFEDLKSAIEKSNQLSVNTTIRALTPEYTAIATDAVAFTANHNVTILPDDESASFTLKRGEVTGDLLTFVQPGTKTLTLINTTLDGTANDGVTTTGSLIKMGGANILTLNNSSAINNTTSSSGVCGIDASGSTGKVNLVGNVNVKDNTADGANANLKVNGTTRLTLTGNLTGQEVGVTTPQGIGTQFAYGSSSYTGYETLINDAEANVRPYYNSATAIYWRYTYLGLVYTFTGTGESTKAKVSNFDLTYKGGIPTVADTIPYNGYDVPVTDLTYFGSAATLKYKNLFFSESMLNKMANGAVIGLPDIVAHFNEAIDDAVEGYIAGVNNANSQGAKNVWKKAEYNPETNQIEYTLKYLQLMTQDQPLDFVFSIDQTSTMCTADATAYGVTAPRVIWMMALLQKTAYELVSRNGDGYINQVAFIPWGTSATKSEFMGTNEEITEWFSGRDAYSHVEEGTNHSKPAQACVEMAHASLDANRIPVIIYMSDFQSNANSNRNNAYVRELRQTTDYKTYAINIFADASAYGEYYQNSGVYFADEPAEFMEAFTMIIKDAIGYYLNKPLVIEDGMSSPLAGTTPTEDSADGLLETTAGQATWTLGKQEPLLNAGNLYSSTFTVQLEDDAIYSGAMPTNAGVTVEEAGTVVNRINVSPILSKALTLVLKGSDASGALLAGATFTLTHGSNTWNLTTDANGQLVLPWGENDVVGASTATSTFAFNPGDTYTLTQLATINGYVRPGGTWTLSVGSDFKVTPTTTPGAGNVNRTRDMVAVGGKFEIYNDSEPTLTYVPNGGTGTPIAVGAIDVENNEPSHAYTTLNATESSFTYDDRTLIGWNTEGDGSGTSYGLGANVTLSRGEDENIVLYAQWSGEPIIARVSNDGGDTWTMHSYLINNNYDPSNDPSEKQGAFDKANELDGDVIIETLLESHARYSLTQGFTFDNGDITKLTLRTTQDDSWNPETADGRFTSTISRGYDGYNLLDFAISGASFTLENIILDGGHDFSTNPSTGYTCSRNGGLVNMGEGSGTLIINDATLQNSYVVDYAGGGIYTKGDVNLSGTVAFTNCVSYGDGGGVCCGHLEANDSDVKILMTNCVSTYYNGGGIFAETVEINGQADFENCMSGYDPSSRPDPSGGAIYADEITLVGDFSFDGCRSSNFGGAIYGRIISLNGNIEITDCYAVWSGGGIYASGDANLAGNISITGCSTGDFGGGIYLTSNASLTVSGKIIVEDNTHGTGDNTVADDVYLNETDNKYITIGDDGLLCESHIGVYKTTDADYYTDDNDVSYTDIVHGTNANCLFAFQNGFFFDDNNLYGVYYMGNYDTYAEGTIYFIENWEGQASTAEAGTDYVLSGDYVTEVKTAKGLAYFAKDVNSGKNYYGKTVILSNDIDLSGRYWVPIGQAAMGSCSTSGNPFKGTFDGQGKIISNMTSILPYQYMGLFGNVVGGTITNTFVESGELHSNYSAEETTDKAYVGGIVGLINSGKLTYCEAQVNMTSSPNANSYMGGLVGYGTTSVNIHSSIAIPEMTNSSSCKMGGIAGYLNSCFVENSMANLKFNSLTSPYTIGGIVAEVHEVGIYNNYVRLRDDVPTPTSNDVFGWLAGEAEEFGVEHSYIPNGYTNVVGYTEEEIHDYGTFTPAVKVDGKYGYGQRDLQMTIENITEEITADDIAEYNNTVEGGLTAILNSWVDDTESYHYNTGYARWTRTMASSINDDYPVLMMPGSNSLGSKDGLFIYYDDNVNELWTEKGFNNLSSDDYPNATMFLYDVQPTIDPATIPAPVTITGNTNVPLYIHEDVGITQADNAKLNARVGVTFDNSSNNMLGGKNYDWHMFSTSLSDASLGINYGTPAAGVGFGHQIADGDITLTKYGYYPTNTPFASFDFYAYHEPSRHYINLKRNTGNHWHQATQEPIEYTNEENLLKGKGYLMAIDKETMLMADGVLNNDDVTTEELKYTTSEDEGDAKQTGINLIGNPYQSYLDFEMFAKDGGENDGLIRDKAYYILDADRGGYITYPDQASENPVYAPRYVHPHQGFFVAVDGATTLKFTNDMRSAEGSEYSYFRGEQVNYPLVNLICTDANGKCDLTTVEIDRPEVGGARKLHKMHTGDALLYAHFNNQSYQALFAPQGIREVPVRLEVFEDGVFTITWSMLHGDFSYVHLIDNLTGADINLMTNDSYRFEAHTDDYTSRFRLVFDVTGIDEYDDDQNGASAGSGAFAFFDGNSWVVTGEGTLQMFDVNGRCLMSTNTEGTQSSVILPKVAPGVYMLRLGNSNNTQVQKIVVR